MWLSVIIAAYNAEDTLSDAVDSLVSQWRNDSIELVIVDDGSIDSTGALADALAARQPRITTLHKPNGGTASAFNAALTVANGDFISALGADDVLEPTYVDTMHRFINEHPGFDIYSHDLIGVGPGAHGQRLYGWENARSFTFSDLLEENLISGGGILVKRELVMRLGGWRNDVYAEDYDLWLRALFEGARHLYCPVPLYRYTVGQEGQKTSNLTRTIESNIRMFEMLLEDPRISEDQAVKIRARIDRYSSLLKRVPRLRTNASLALQAERLHRKVERVTGPRFVEPALRVIHLFSWTTRPLRRLILRIQAARAH